MNTGPGTPSEREELIATGQVIDLMRVLVKSLREHKAQTSAEDIGRPVPPHRSSQQYLGDRPRCVVCGAESPADGFVKALDGKYRCFDVYGCNRRAGELPPVAAALESQR